jgi:hypothetical protein
MDAAWIGGGFLPTVRSAASRDATAMQAETATERAILEFETAS